MSREPTRSIKVIATTIERRYDGVSTWAVSARRIHRQPRDSAPSSRLTRIRFIIRSNGVLSVVYHRVVCEKKRIENHRGLNTLLPPRGRGGIGSEGGRDNEEHGRGVFSVTVTKNDTSTTSSNCPRINRVSSINEKKWMDGNDVHCGGESESSNC